MKFLAVIKSGDGYVVNGVVMNNGQVSETYNNTVVCKDIAESLKAMPKDMAGGFFGSVIKAPTTSKTVALDVPDDLATKIVEKYKVVDDKSEIFAGRAQRRSLDQVRADVLAGIADGTIQLQDNLRDKANGGKIWKRKVGDSWISLTKTELMYVPTDK